jgi:thiopeptide-type bacteriocin biosynthesis protein
VNALKHQGVTRRWFFVRYWDERPHLRVRLDQRSRQQLDEARWKLEEALHPHLEAGDAWSLQFDTYEPEIERYGGPAAIQAAERFFAADSDMAASMIALDPGRVSDHREQLAVAAVHALLDDFGFDIPKRRVWTQTVRDALFAEFQLGSDAAISLGRCFRSVRHMLEGLLDLPGPRPGEHEGSRIGVAVRELLDNRAREAKRFAEILSQLDRDQQLTASVSGVVASLAHMTVNRLVPDGPRLVEVAVLDLLHRLYTSWAARSASAAAVLSGGRPEAVS